jgi:hypothetical protein
MSSAPEALVACQAGMSVLGLSVVSNINDPDNFQPILIEDIVAESEKAGEKLRRLLWKIVKLLPSCDAETRFKTMAAEGNIPATLAILDCLDGKTS